MMRAGRISCLQDHCHLFQPSRVRIFTRSYARRKNLDPQEKTALKDDSKDTKSTLEQAPPSTPTSNEDHDNPANRTTSAAVRWLSNRQTRVGSQLSRVNIVNTELCNDLIARLAPSLRRHANCDIIDLSCGVGYWSAALHELLQPRSHVLVEEDEGSHLPFLRPLLDKPGSRYRFFPLSSMGMGIFDRLIQGGFLANHQRFEPGDPRRDLPNDSLLLVANLAQVHRAHSPGYRRSSLLMYLFLQAARLYSGLQAYGRVRMLVWTNDTDKKLILPRSVMGRWKYSVQADLALESAFEIAGLDEHAGMRKQWRRDRSFDLSRSVEVTRGMLQRGVRTPPERKGQLQKEAEAIIEGKAESEDAFDGVKRTWHAELEALEQGFREGAFSRWQTTNSSGEQTRQKKGARRAHTPEYQRLFALRHFARRNAKVRAAFMDRVDESREPYQVNKESPSGDAVPQPDTTSESTASFELKSDLDDLSSLERLGAEAYRDETLAARMKPPLLLWDRRIDEPLIIHESDFYPRQGMALVDLHPKPGAPHLSEPHAYETHEYIVSRLFSNPRQTVGRAIESLAPGAFEALTPHVPALRDPAKGGHPDLNFRARLITTQMIEGLFDAWIHWPFRLSRREIVLSGEEVALDLDGRMDHT